MALHSVTRMKMMRSLLIATLIATTAPAWAGQQASMTPAALPQTSRPAVHRAKPASAKTAKAPSPAERRNPSAAALTAGKRDPFKLPLYADPNARGGGAVKNGEGIGGVLPPGARGLLISQLRLEGVVREQVNNKMIAVVTNETRRAYFLTENEAVYNGLVSKITPDSIYFKENVLDANGRVTTREVVKRMNPASGEGR